MNTANTYNSIFRSMNLDDMESSNSVPKAVLPTEQFFEQQSQPFETSQPNPPTPFSFSKKQVLVYASLFLTPILFALAITNSAKLHASNTGIISPMETETLQTQHSSQVSPVAANTAQPTANLASAQNSHPSASQANEIEYELSLAQGFLKKAITLSNAKQEQTVEDKQQIIEYLNEALEASNRAIAQAPEDARAYTTRGRVYQATSVIKPEMKALAESDFSKAQSLGATAPTAAATEKNPVELLPTQQAHNPLAQQTVIAAPEDKQQQAASTKTTSNLLSGTVELPAGREEIFVSNKEITDTTQVVVEVEKSANLTVFVKQKVAGKGFIITATSAPTAAAKITWNIIK